MIETMIENLREALPVVLFISGAGLTVISSLYNVFTISRRGADKVIEGISLMILSIILFVASIAAEVVLG